MQVSTRSLFGWYSISVLHPAVAPAHPYAQSNIFEKGKAGTQTHEKTRGDDMAEKIQGLSAHDGKRIDESALFQRVSEIIEIRKYRA